MTRDYSSKRNYRSSSNLNNISRSNNSYQSRQTRSSNNNYNNLGQAIDPIALEARVARGVQVDHRLGHLVVVEDNIID